MKIDEKINITLIGMAAVGKTAVGKELAKRLDYSFVDMDEVIEKETGLKLQQILDDLGDDGFMRIEENVILGLGRRERCIISTGGSVVYSAKAMDFLKKNSAVIFLNASFESIGKRLTNEETRGIVGLKKKSLEDLFDERMILYKRYADVEVELSDESDVHDAVRYIVDSEFFG